MSLLSIAAVEDIRSHQISNRLIITGLLIGIIFQAWEYQALGIYYFFRNISVPVILLYLLFQMRVLGAGDIKLFSMIGGILTIWELQRCMAYSFLAAGAGSLLFLAADKSRKIKLWYAARYLFACLHTGWIPVYRPPKEAEDLVFAFSVPVFFGTVCALYFPVQ